MAANRLWLPEEIYVDAKKKKFIAEAELSLRESTSVFW